MKREMAMCEYVLRQADTSDVDGIYEIERESFATPWSRETIENELAKNTFAKYFVLEKEDEVIGYIGMWLIIDEAHVTNVAIKEKYRGMGYGTVLLEYALDVAEDYGMIGITLEVRTGNEVAIGLYEKYGFTVEGKRPNYYQDTNEDAYIMWKYF